jgi:hypothetical protein
VSVCLLGEKRHSPRSGLTSSSASLIAQHPITAVDYQSTCHPISPHDSTCSQRGTRAWRSRQVEAMNDSKLSHAVTLFTGSTTPSTCDNVYVCQCMCVSMHVSLSMSVSMSVYVSLRDSVCLFLGGRTRTDGMMQHVQAARLSRKTLESTTSLWIGRTCLNKAA